MSDAARSELIGDAILAYQRATSPTLDTLLGHVNGRLTEHGHELTSNTELTGYLMFAPAEHSPS